MSNDIGKVVGSLPYSSSVDVDEAHNVVVVDKNLGRVEVSMHGDWGFCGNGVESLHDRSDPRGEFGCHGVE